MGFGSVAKRATELLVDLIEIDSTSTHEHQVAKYLHEWAQGEGLPVSVQPVSGAGPNLMIGSTEPTLLLTAHMDTIVPTWPWSGRASVDGDWVSGLGAQDDKGCVVSALLALLMARADGIELAGLPVAVGLTVDEEENGTGSVAMAAAYDIPYVIALEGTDFRICTAEAGTVEGHVELFGVRAHGAMAEEGDNAIHKAVDFVQELRALPVLAGSHPLLGPNLVTVLQIDGGSELFVVPDHAHAHLDLRVGSTGEGQAALAQLEALCERFGARFELTEAVEPFTVDPASPLIASLGQAVRTVTGAEPEYAGMPSWTDAHPFAEAGGHAVVFGPGTLRQAHRPDERIRISEVVTGARILADVIARTAQLNGARG